ncbi:protease FtsH-inhibitory lysogeny factor CIII [Cronobacter dublinensis]|nr:protease FtsH-inhibitory lysogeny factor CIII [Cronobacter dublinensis]
MTLGITKKLKHGFLISRLSAAFSFPHINSASFEAFSLCQLTKDNTMQQFAFAGWPVVGCSESLLDLITRRMRGICKTLKELTCTAIKQ